MTIATTLIPGSGRHRSWSEFASQNALLLGCWAVFVTLGVQATFAILPDGMSNDDAMRLVGVRDLLAGQPWFDVTQYRLGPSGSLMHWSRLIDLPIALLLKFFGPFVDKPMAERLTMMIWPMLLLLPALAAMRALGQALHGPAAGKLALVLGALLAPMVGHFRPGALDHHGAQIVLLLWTAVWVARFTARDAIFAGCAMGTSIAIGLEMLPAIATLAIFAGLRWIAEGESLRRESAAFGLSFAAATGILVIATIPPSRWTVVACDALSIAHVLAAAVGGLGLASLAFLCSGQSTARRLLGAACIALAAVTAVALVAPACLGNPYDAVHPKLQEFWLASVIETQSIVALLAEPVKVIINYLPSFGAMILSAVAVRRVDRKAAWRWATVIALQAVLLAVAMWEVRGAAVANFVAAALLAASLATLFPPTTDGARLWRQRVVMIAPALMFTPLLLEIVGNSVAHAVQPIARTSPQDPSLRHMQCRNVSSFSALGALPAGRALALIDAGAAILLQTPHSVLAAPYHRNNDGNLAVVQAFLAPPAEAYAGLIRHDIDYVVTCAGAPEVRLYKRFAPDGLAAQLARNIVPKYLEPIPLGDSPVQAYRFIRER